LLLIEEDAAGGAKTMYLAKKQNKGKERKLRLKKNS
jgi:hypothetical protein